MITFIMDREKKNYLNSLSDNLIARFIFIVFYVTDQAFVCRLNRQQLYWRCGGRAGRHLNPQHTLICTKQCNQN